MKRRIIRIDEELCNGCGLCVEACHEGAIGIIAGKAKLLRDDYCDGLGDCLPVCPVNAITFEERDALPYDEIAVKMNKEGNKGKAENAITLDKPLPCGCPGTNLKHMKKQIPADVLKESSSPTSTASHLSQWPVQIKLVPVNASFFDGANLLVAADCTAFAFGDIHNRFIKNHITIIGCPKLDMTDYSEKLTAILKNNDIKSIKIVRMEVPCCGGIETAVKKALQNSGKLIPWQVFTISTEGELLE